MGNKRTVFFVSDQTGVTDNRTLLRDKLPDVVTFPQLLKESGWHSAAFGKILHLGVSVEKVEEALKAIEYPNVTTIQIIFNMFRL